MYVFFVDFQDADFGNVNLFIALVQLLTNLGIIPKPK
jgi:hypothetical protein